MPFKTIFSPLTITTLSLLGIVIIGTISILSIEVLAPKLDQDKSASASISSSLAQTSSVLSSSSQNLFTTQVVSNQLSINFTYNSSTQKIDYSGTVTGSNGCIFIEKYDLTMQNNKLLLQVKTGSKGDICTQVITSLPIKGEKNIELSQAQRSDFKNLFEVEIKK
jgi:hypothetical protein